MEASDSSRSTDSRLDANANFADSVCEIDALPDFADAVWRIYPSRNAPDDVRSILEFVRLGPGLPVALVGLRAPALRQEPASPRLYETEALRCGWSVRQLDRQVSSQFYERTALSLDKAAMLKKGEVIEPRDAITPEQVIKDPLRSGRFAQ